MAEIVIVTWDGGGNVPPALAIARELRSRGHRIRVLGHRSQHRAIEESGFRVVPAPEARDFTAAGAHGTRELLATFGDRGMGRDLLAELQREPADLVLVDALMLGALDAARASGTRYAVLEHLFDGYLRGALRGPLGLVLRARRLRPGRAFRDAAVRIVTTLPELDPVDPDAGVRQVGPIVEWGPRVQGEPTVLVGLSTFGYPDMTAHLQQVLDACSVLPARVVVTTGPHVDPAALTTRGGVEVHRFVPHRELMPEVTVFVGHGGHGSAMAALAHDVPVVVIPLDPRSDHRAVGRSIQLAGAGALLEPDVAPQQLAGTVAGLLAAGPHREAAARLGHLVRSSAGARGAADALDAALAAPAPAARR